MFLTSSSLDVSRSVSEDEDYNVCGTKNELKQTQEWHWKTLTV